MSFAQNPPQDTTKGPQLSIPCYWQKQIECHLKHQYEEMKQVACRMINHIGWLVVEDIKTLKISQGLEVKTFACGTLMVLVILLQVHRMICEKCSGRDDNVLLSWKQGMVIVLSFPTSLPCYLSLCYHD